MVYYLILCIIIINIIKDLAILVHFKYVLNSQNVVLWFCQFAKSQHCGTQVQANLESETLKDHIRRNWNWPFHGLWTDAVSVYADIDNGAQPWVYVSLCSRKEKNPFLWYFPHWNISRFDVLGCVPHICIRDSPVVPGGSPSLWPWRLYLDSSWVW